VFDISPIQVIIVLVIALLVFGPKRLPEMGRSIGRGIREFKGSIMDDEAPPARPRETEPEAPRAASAAPAVARDDEDDDVLEGVVVPGDTPPRPPAA
jgi:sec-independent protein translocase protein TatA